MKSSKCREKKPRICRNFVLNHGLAAELFPCLLKPRAAQPSCLVSAPRVLAGFALQVSRSKPERGASKKFVFRGKADSTPSSQAVMIWVARRRDGKDGMCSCDGFGAWDLHGRYWMEKRDGVLVEGERRWRGAGGLRGGELVPRQRWRSALPRGVRAAGPGKAASSLLGSGDPRLDTGNGWVPPVGERHLRAGASPV